jgi:TRAP-type transport system small permease protein
VEWFTRANGRLTLWLARIAAIALAIIAAVTFCDVIGRYFFHAPFIFTVELTQIAMGLVVYFGIGLVTHEDAHISADVLTLRLRPRSRALLALVTNLLALGFVGLMVWQLWAEAVLLREKGDTTQVWSVPLWPVAVTVAFGGVFLITGVLLHLLNAWAQLTGAQPPAAPPSVRQPYRE